MGIALGTAAAVAVFTDRSKGARCRPRRAERPSPGE